MIAAAKDTNNNDNDLFTKTNDELEEELSNVNIEFKEKYQQILNQKNEVETVLTHMADGVISFGLDGKVTLINPAARKYLNVKEAEKFR